MTITKEELEQNKKDYMRQNNFASERAWRALPPLFEALEQAWAERVALIKERDFLSTQNTELLEDIAAVREECATLKADLEWAKVYDPFSLRACPLCRYEYGLYQSPCSFHAEIAALKAKVVAND